MSARPYDTMNVGSSYPSFGISGIPPLPDSEDELMSEVDSILGNEPPMAEAEVMSENPQVAQAIRQFDFSNLSAAQMPTD